MTIVFVSMRKRCDPKFSGHYVKNKIDDIKLIIKCRLTTNMCGMLERQQQQQQRKTGHSFRCTSTC